MSVFDTIANQAGRLVDEVQTSVKRARIEGERRLLQRQHRTALETLGERAYELARAGRLSEQELEPELSEVERRLMEMEAKITELDDLRDEEGDEEDPSAQEGSAPPKDAAATAFPMVDETPQAGAGAGPGWDAAARYFAAEDEGQGDGRG